MVVFFSGLNPHRYFTFNRLLNIPKWNENKFITNNRYDVIPRKGTEFYAAAAPRYYGHIFHGAGHGHFGRARPAFAGRRFRPFPTAGYFSPRHHRRHLCPARHPRHLQILVQTPLEKELHTQAAPPAQQTPPRQPKPPLIALIFRGLELEPAKT